MNTVTLFNIQKFSIHDGPGIRTTLFFKGCPLHCLWCHNPESQQPLCQLLVTHDRCNGCGDCIGHCPQQAIHRTVTNQVIINRALCNACGSCTDFCSTNVREISGRTYTINEILAEVEKDRPFYEQSGGGVTLSGGEALGQIDFATELARLCQKRGISVAVDTCGHVPFQHFERIMDYVDLFLYDIKLMDSAQHRQFTGQDNHLILANLQKLAARGARIHLRLPLIDEVNTTADNINNLITFIKDLPLVAIHLLPYHNTAVGKYDRLGRSYPTDRLQRPSDDTVNHIRTLLESAGFPVMIGG